MTSESAIAVAVNKKQHHKIEIKLYKRRWFMLGLFIFYGAIVAGQWLQYSVISNIISRYYNVSTFWVDCTSMATMLFYVIFIFPMTYMSQKVGLRWSVIIGSALCCLGSWIKAMSTAPDRFFTSLLGQCIASVSWTLMTPLPGRLAAQWFASDELSTVTSLGVFGPQLGDCITFLLTPVLVKNHENVEEIEPELFRLFLMVAIASSVNVVLCILFFQEEPKIPPNETRALQQMSDREKKEGFVAPFKRLLTNKSYLILLNSYGLNVGALNAVATMLNQLFLIHFKNGEEDVGRIGLIIIVTGILGSIAFGVILDRTRKFKETICTAYFFTLVGQILYAATLLMEIKWMVYVAVIVVGIFLYGFPTLGYELAVEYTYPESEIHSAGVLNITQNVYGMVLILILERVIEHYGDVPVHVILCLVLLVGLIMVILTKDEQRRQDARKAAQYQNVPMDEVKENNKIDDGTP